MSSKGTLRKTWRARLDRVLLLAKLARSRLACGSSARGTTGRGIVSQELLGAALDQYRLDVGVYPNTSQGLDSL